MHASEREEQILKLVNDHGFLSFQDLDRTFNASPATLRRDLGRLAETGKLRRVRGGARSLNEQGAAQFGSAHLAGTPFSANAAMHHNEKQAIGRAAAALCARGEGVMIDGGSTTLQMCDHLADLGLQVLTNSLHIVLTLLSQEGTTVLVPSGTVFREQNIILAAKGEDSMPRFHAPKLFMGAAAIGLVGLMQADSILVAAERGLIERAEKVIVLVDSSKFRNSSGAVVCSLEDIDIVITDHGIRPEEEQMLVRAGVEVIKA
ncbi:MAG: DeoR/GlpR transcriptional regulator [Oxalobacteraceae bacterium]|nr:MAG: DeoR/GlpR transcriptional regulator [Oxalobacteraceae bacterium]